MSSSDNKIKLIRVLYNNNYGGFNYSNNFLKKCLSEFYNHDETMTFEKLENDILSDDSKYRYGKFAKLFESIYINNELNLPVNNLFNYRSYNKLDQEYKDWITTLNINYVPFIFKDYIHINEYDGYETITINKDKFGNNLLDKIIKQKELKDDDIELYNEYHNILKFYYSHKPSYIKDKEEFNKYYTIIDD